MAGVPSIFVKYDLTAQAHDDGIPFSLPVVLTVWGQRVNPSHANCVRLCLRRVSPVTAISTDPFLVR
jgi:hypothetical protein